MSSGGIMKINKERTVVYSKVYEGLLAMVPEDIFNAEDCVDFKWGVGKAMAKAIAMAESYDRE